jgi:hypothetical protein
LVDVCIRIDPECEVSVVAAFHLCFLMSSESRIGMDRLKSSLLRRTGDEIHKIISFRCVLFNFSYVVFCVGAHVSQVISDITLLSQKLFLLYSILKIFTRTRNV